MDALKAAIAARKAALKRPDINQSNNQANNQTNNQTNSLSNKQSTSEPPAKRFKTNREIQAEKFASESTSQADNQPINQPVVPVENANNATERPDDDLTTDSKDQSSADETNGQNQSNDQDVVPSTDQSINQFEVKKRLRALGAQIHLFGETPVDRLNRLKNQSIDQSSRADLTGKGRNLLQAILNQEVERELSQQIHANMEKERLNDDQSINQSISQSNRSKKTIKYSTLSMKRSNYESDSDFVLAFLRRLLSEWELDLLHRSVDVARSVAGKMQSAAQKQTREYVKPLIDLLKARACDVEMLRDIHAVCLAAARGQYQQSQQQYLKLAIGNAPWPMGVTMVSIHERSGRQRIQGDQVAHVLNDDTQRKYISSIKRLVTWAQEHHPHGFEEAKEDQEQTT